MIIINAPLRISFFGGGTDLPLYYRKRGVGGVLSTTISLSLRLILNFTMNPTIKVMYSEIENVTNIEDLKHDRVKHSLKMLGINSGIEIASFADVSTKGTGLGSSSAYTAALLKGLTEAKGISLTRHDLAELTCRVEIEQCGDPIGKQDQYATVFGGFNTFEFYENERVDVKPVQIGSTALQLLGENLVMVDLNMARSTTDVLKTIEPNTLWFKNMDRIGDMVGPAERALRDGEVEIFGCMLHDAWMYKKEMSSKVSNEDIDHVYHVARCAGALGGKLLGAGAGGSFLFYVPREKRNGFEYSMALNKLKIRDFKFTDEGTKVIANV